jgi:transcriptional regulator with XRE-family HTH domain
MSGPCFTVSMATPSREGDRRRRNALRRIRNLVGEDARSLRLDAGLPIQRVAGASGISRSHLNEIELGTADGSLPTLVALADSLGADVSIRLYQNTGPRVRDHIQARIVEELLRIAHPRWRRMTEVPVYKPARGRIDIVFHDPRPAEVVATEVQSQVRRLEQQLGWARMKADSLSSADFWRFADSPTVGQLLVIRSTRATRDLARQFEATLRAAYPASAADAFGALAGDGPWPGNAVLWADVTGDGVRVLDRPPRGVMLGR